MCCSASLFRYYSDPFLQTNPQPQPRQSCLQEQVEDLVVWNNQAAALRFLLRPLDEEGADADAHALLVTPQKLERAETPEDAAIVLLNTLQDQLSQHVPMWLHRPFLT